MADKFFIEKKREKSGKVIAKHNFAWFLGCIILLLISVTFILPATGVVGFFSANEYTFGSFGKQKIKYTQDSFMARAADVYRKQYSAFVSGGSNDDFINRLALQGAYQDAVLYEACKYYSHLSGYSVSSDEVDDNILAMSDFSKEGWSQMNSANRQKTRENVESTLYTQHFIENLTTNTQDSKKNAEFASGLLPEAKNFSAIVYIGEDADEKSTEALAKLKKGKSIDDCAKEQEKTVSSINNVFEKNFPLIPSANASGDVGKFYEALNKNPDLRSSLFALKAKQVYPDVISVNDNEKLVVVANGDISSQDAESNKTMIESSMKNDAFYTFRDLVISSPLHKDNFSTTYKKMFPSST